VTRAVLSIGSNVGDRRAQLRIAVDTVRPWLVACSPVYRTPPWGPIEQDDFLNAILIVDDPAAGARDWLARARLAEAAAHRVRTQRWGPRSLDVDVITVDDLSSDDPDLTLPHPRAAERAFVLVPWLAVDPAATLFGVPVRELISRLPAGDVDQVVPDPAEVG
jgi:2-amino-4-hydroxy-6-hydroxymethyldihydropteridine diphosphokinase